MHALGSPRFDVTNLHATGPGATSPLVRLVGMPVVVTVHGLDWRREIWGRGARAVSQIAACSVQSVRTERSSSRASSSATTAHRRYTSRTARRSNEIPGRRGQICAPTLSCLGRLAPEKQAHRLIRAYRRVGGRHAARLRRPRFAFSKYFEQLRALAAGDPRVRLIGPQYGREKAWLMHNAFDFAQRSSIGGSPIALLEAYRRGDFPS